MRVGVFACVHDRCGAKIPQVIDEILAKRLNCVTLSLNFCVTCSALLRLDSG